MENYNKLLEKAQKAYKNCVTGAEKRRLESIFPELKVSEDERNRSIKNEVVEMLHYYHSKSPCFIPPKFSLEETLAWLEKQSEQKPADKIEPKFKVCDWITDGEYIWKVTNIKRLDYILQSQNGDIVDDTISYVDEHFHLWTIEDTKDGDVLVIENGRRNDECFFIFKDIADREVLEHCYYRTSDNTFSPIGSFIGYLDNVYHPATKEQRDLLFQKMKEAGYEWDAENKELKKIDDYYEGHCKGFQETGKCFADGECKAKRDAEQNPAWSGEDELMFTSTINSLKLTNGASDMKINWLRSLKPQPHWKPTEEQMNAFYWMKQYPAGEFAKKDILNSLYNDLKKL